MIEDCNSYRPSFHLTLTSVRSESLVHPLQQACIPGGALGQHPLPNITFPYPNFRPAPPPSSILARVSRRGVAPCSLAPGLPVSRSRKTRLRGCGGRECSASNPRRQSILLLMWLSAGSSWSLLWVVQGELSSLTVFFLNCHSAADAKAGAAPPQSLRERNS